MAKGLSGNKYFGCEYCFGVEMHELASFRGVWLKWQCCPEQLSTSKLGLVSYSPKVNYY